MEDQSTRVRDFIQYRRDAFLQQEGFPRVSFQPPTPNMPASGPVIEDRGIAMEERPSSTDSGWFPPPIERSPSGMDFHARPTGFLSPASRFETTREHPLTASTQIWGNAEQNSLSRGHSPLEPGHRNHGAGGRRLYESASYGPSRISTPNTTHPAPRIASFTGVPTGPSAGPVSRPGLGQHRPGSAPRGGRHVSQWW